MKLKIIGLVSKAGGGKDEFAKLAVKEFGGKRIAFADQLKIEVGAFLDFSEVCWEHRNLWGDQNDKEATLRLGHKSAFVPQVWNDYLTEAGHYISGCWHFTPRTLLQFWGSMKRKQDVDYWVKQCLMDLNPDQLYCVSDVRYPNEAEAIRAKGGTLVQILRKDAPVISGANHISETALDGYMFDYVISNDGSLWEYHDQIRKVVRSIINEC